MIETTTNDPIPPNGLLDISATLGPDGEKKGDYGLLLEVVSPKWEELFQKISGGKTTFTKKSGFELDLYDFSPAETDRGFYSLYPSRDLFDSQGSGKPSLFFLRMKGLSEGVRVFFKGMHEFDMVKKFTHQAADESLSLYKKLLGGSIKARVILDDWKSAERVVR